MRKREIIQKEITREQNIYNINFKRVRNLNLRHNNELILLKEKLEEKLFFGLTIIKKLHRCFIVINEIKFPFTLEYSFDYPPTPKIILMYDTELVLSDKLNGDEIVESHRKILTILERLIILKDNFIKTQVELRHKYNILLSKIELDKHEIAIINCKSELKEIKKEESMTIGYEYIAKFNYEKLNKRTLQQVNRSIYEILVNKIIIKETNKRYITLELYIRPYSSTNLYKFYEERKITKKKFLKLISELNFEYSEKTKRLIKFNKILKKY